MLRLIILRHAKSDWNTGEPDHARPLNSRGRREAPLTGKALSQLGWLPELVLASDSKRTEETWEYISPELGDVPIIWKHILYSPTIDAYQEAVVGTPGTIKTLMLLSHNPGSEELVELLSGKPQALKPASCALLTIDNCNTFAEAFNKKGDWTFVRIINPKD